MRTHITLTTFVVFFAMAAFGAVVFALARSASHGAFSPNEPDDDTPLTEEAAPGDATDESTAPVQHPARGQDTPSSLDL